MLRLLLNAHSRLLVPRELKYFTSLPMTAADKNWSQPTIDESQYRTWLTSYFDGRSDLFDGIDLSDLVADILGSPRRDYRAPYVAAMNALAKRDGKVRWGEKTPKNLFYVDVLSEMFPEARFVYLVRDPRAVVNSMNAIKYYSKDATINACNWRQSATDGYALLCSEVPEAQRMVVRYEDLVANPELTMRALCRFLGEEYEPGILAFYERTESNMPKTIRSPLLKAPITENNAEKWRSVVPPEQIARIESVCGDAMRTFGYERDGRRLSPRGLLATQMRVWYWKWKRARGRDVRAAEICDDPFARYRSNK